jgi:CRP/FNR family transcriptional regulator, cyclic AMP receptor protein
MIRRILHLRPGVRGSSSGLDILGDTAAFDKLGLLQESDLFHDLNGEQMKDVEEMTVMTSCKRGSLIYGQDDRSESLFLLKRGRVTLYRLSPEGKKLTIAPIAPGTLFGDMEFTGSTLAGSFAEASEDSILCVITRRDLESLISRYPSIGIRLLNVLSRRMRDLEARLEEGLLRDMPARVAAAVLRLREEQGKDEVRVTHQELADTLGTYRETVTSTLGELQERGLVSLERTRIVVNDATALEWIVARGAPQRD